MADNLGEALLLGQSGDIQIERRDSETKDLRTIEGPHEVVQALTILLETHQGEDVLFPEYGMPVQDVIGPFNEDLVAAVVRQTLQQERRVRSIDDISVTFTSSDKANRVARVEADVTLANAEQMTITAMMGV